MANYIKHCIPPLWTYRIRCVFLDAASYAGFVLPPALACYLAARFTWRFRPDVSLSLLSKAHIILLTVWGQGRAVRWLNQNIETTLARACQREGLLLPPKFHSARGVFEAVSTTAVLKAPRIDAGSVVEKGVLLLKYSIWIAAFSRHVEMEVLLQHYDLVLEPSWTGYASHEFLAFTRCRQHSIVVFSPFRGDREFLERLGSNLVPIELGAGDWVDPRVFRPLEGEPKRYDMVMIARWHPTKRHDLLLRALRQIADPGYRVAVLARRQNPNRAAILMAIQSSGLGRQIDVLEDLAPSEVNRVLNQAKVNVLLSRQEGANRGLFEGFFAGTPGIAFRGHIGVRTEHFLPETGRLIERADLAKELLYFREHWSRFNPRPWALSHITPEISTQRLNEFLKERSLKRGDPWTKDLVMKCNRPDLRYYPDDAAGQGLPTMETVLSQFQRR